MVGLVIVLFLLIFSALISGSEVAFFSLESKALSKLRRSKSHSKKTVFKLLSRPNYLLGTILIANNVINVAIIILFSFIASKYFDFSGYPIIGVIVEVILITGIIVLFGEIIPKMYATQHGLKLAEIMAFPILFLEKILKPATAVLISSTNWIEKGIKMKAPNISVEELSRALELTEAGSGNNDQTQMLKDIVKLGFLDVKQIMKPRTDVIAFEKSTGFQALLDGILASGYSRIPIYEESFDKILGILYLKDLLPYIEENDSFRWQGLIRPPIFVPENKKIDDLFKEFQNKKIHFAVVVDEYGGTSGIVTLEDVLEEVIGEINDELDDDELVYSKLDESNYIFEGKIPLHDLSKVTGIEYSIFDTSKGDSDTLAGLILELEGKIPEKNKVIKFKNLSLKIESSDNRRIKRIKLTMDD